MLKMCLLQTAATSSSSAANLGSGRSAVDVSRVRPQQQTVEQNGDGPPPQVVGKGGEL